MMTSVTGKVQDLVGGATEVVQAGETRDWDACWEVCNFLNTGSLHILVHRTRKQCLPLHYESVSQKAAEGRRVYIIKLFKRAVHRDGEGRQSSWWQVHAAGRFPSKNGRK